MTSVHTGRLSLVCGSRCHGILNRLAEHLAVAIAYLLYTFLFAQFKKERGTGRRRRLAFELIHFPLTFGLLLMFNGMVVSHLDQSKRLWPLLNAQNVIVVTSHGSGTASVLTDFAKATEDASNNLPLTDELQMELGRYLYKMPLYPPFDTLLDQLRGYYNSSSPSSTSRLGENNTQKVTN